MVNDFMVRLSMRSAMFAGAITGFVFGLFIGAAFGAVVTWFAGAIIEWQAQQLLPLGDQINYLDNLADRWYLVIPGVGLVFGLLGAFMGLLAGGLWAALVNMGVLPIEVAVYRRDELDLERRASTRRARRERRRSAVGE